MLKERKMKEIHILALIAQVEEISSAVDVDEIVAKNNITDLCTLEILHDIAISKNMKMNSYASKVQNSQEFQLHNQVIPYTTSTWDDSNDDYVENDEFFVENANNFDGEDVIESFVSSLENPIHDSSSQKDIIERLENKISEFELKVQSYEFKLQNLKKNYQIDLGEVATLKMKVQTLETENRALKSSCISTSFNSMDLDKVIGQRPSNKSGLGYKKSSKTSNCPKSKEKQSQGSNAKIMKSANAKSFNKKHNYAFQYKQFDKKINKEKMNFQSNNAIFF
jgi:hypothetical protein